jgi:hypothetical protein
VELIKKLIWSTFPLSNLLLVLLIFTNCQKPKSILEKVISSSNSPIERVTKELEKHEVQIILTQLETQESSKVKFQTSSFQLNENRYFYPASTAKLPIAILALQKLRALQQNGVDIDRETPFEIRDSQAKPVQLKDTTHAQGKLTVGHLIKKIFLVSDNEAYNYLFDFLGRDYINEQLQKKGLKNTQIFHKFLFGADNINTWEYTFFNAEGETLYHQKSMASKFDQNNKSLLGIFKGKGVMKADKVVDSPMDFSTKNRISLLDLEGILKRVIYPDAFPKNQQFELENQDLEFLRFWMSRSTTESTAPNYNDGEHWDSYCKFFIYGDQKGKMNNQIRIYNKVGYAYGTLTDVAYIKDFKNELSFFLSATILVNENEIFNDDKYEFESVGIPFLAELGRLVLDELRKENKLAFKEAEGD